MIAFWAIFDIKKGLVAAAYLTGCLAWYLFVQTKLRCTNCFYFRRLCGRGLGKVAPLLYRGDTGNDVWGNRLGRIFWPWWYFGVPGAAIAFLFATRFNWHLVGYAATYGVAATISWFVDKNVVCGSCVRLGECGLCGKAG